jgi:hypothetical protein
LEYLFLASATEMDQTNSGARRSTPFHHVSALEVFLPGISRMLGGLSTVLAGDLNIFAYIACALGLIGFVQTYINRLLRMLKSHFGLSSSLLIIFLSIS